MSAFKPGDKVIVHIGRESLPGTFVHYYEGTSDRVWVDHEGWGGHCPASWVEPVTPSPELNGYGERPAEYWERRFQETANLLDEEGSRAVIRSVELRDAKRALDVAVTGLRELEDQAGLLEPESVVRNISALLHKIGES